MKPKHDTPGKRANILVLGKRKRNLACKVSTSFLTPLIWSLDYISLRTLFDLLRRRSVRLGGLGGVPALPRSNSLEQVNSPL
jgi:hypothetical protein